MIPGREVEEVERAMVEAMAVMVEASSSEVAALVAVAPEAMGRLDTCADSSSHHSSPHYRWRSSHLGNCC